MARLAMDNKQAFVSGSYPTSGGGGYPTRTPTKVETAVSFGISMVGFGLIGSLLAIAAWGAGLGVASIAGWQPGPILQGVLGGVGLGASLGALLGVVHSLDNNGPSPIWAFIWAVLASLVIALCGIAGGALRLVLSSWFAWPVGGLALGWLVGAVVGVCSLEASGPGSRRRRPR